MASRAAKREIDTTIYRETEKMGESTLQMFILELLRPLVEKWLAKRGVVAFTGSDQFIYYRQYEPTKRVAPDIYVLPGVRPGKLIGAWKTWEEGAVPSFALEVVSDNVVKDYVEVPISYASVGVSELIIFDPEFELAPDRFRFQIYRRPKDRPTLIRVESTNEDRVYSKLLRCFFRSVGSGEDLRLRVGVGAEGDELLPTDAEETERERAEKERERAEKERERAEKERERAEKERLGREVSELRKQLESLGSSRPRKRR